MERRCLHTLPGLEQCHTAREISSLPFIVGPLSLEKLAGDDSDHPCHRKLLYRRGRGPGKRMRSMPIPSGSRLSSTSLVSHEGTTALACPGAWASGREKTSALLVRKNTRSRR
jgi:hypothetical protein